MVSSRVTKAGFGMAHGRGGNHFHRLCDEQKADGIHRIRRHVEQRSGLDTVKRSVVLGIKHLSEAGSEGDQVALPCTDSADRVEVGRLEVQAVGRH